MEAARPPKPRLAEPRLAARDLACRRGERLLFRGLAFDLTRGDALQVVGPNGTGKSSLLRLVAGFLRPLAGTVDHSGSLALLDERLALDEHLPLGKALAFWRNIDGPGAPLDRMGLASLDDVPVRLLSTGQRKRAAFNRLLAQNSQTWLLDEPLNGLDAEGTALVETLIAQHRSEGGIALVASHQPIELPGARRLDLRDFLA